MNSPYAIENPDAICSPALVVFHELVEQNLDHMLRIAGGPSRLRPHCKTHKMAQVVQLQMQRGITRQKCATIAEAEMLAQCGVEDICLAYSLVGPNIARAVSFRQQYPAVQLSVTADDLDMARQLGAAMQRAGCEIDVLLDIDSGQHRTGVELGERAEQLYVDLKAVAGCNLIGLHLYDGQNHQTDLAERRAAVAQIWERAAAFATAVDARGAEVRRFVAGNSGTFPVWSEIDDPRIELSPGTVVFFDAGYGQLFPDLPFQPAALLLTRVVSRPTPQRVTLDLGYKAVAGDPPAGRRVVIPQLPEAREVLHNEEHLVLETETDSGLRVGDWLLAIPRHICPCSALHREAHVVRDGRAVETWSVAARDRRLTV